MLKIIGFGASTMAGASDPEGGFLKRVGVLCEAMGRPVEVINKGIGGETTRDMLKRTDEVTALRPYDLVVQLGCNDFPRTGDGRPEARTDHAEYVRNVGELFRTLRGRRSLYISSFAVSDRTGIAPELFKANMTAAMAAARSAGYDVWDLYAETKPMASQLWAADGAHFGAAGHELIARYVAAWIAQEPSA